MLKRTDFQTSSNPKPSAVVESSSVQLPQLINSDVIATGRKRGESHAFDLLSQA